MRPVPPDRRERKKQATKHLLAETALHLFSERGYDEVTVAEVCDVADVALRTFYRYFPDKESVVFAEDDLLDDAVRNGLLEATGLPPMELIRHVAHALADAFSAIEDLPTRHVLIKSQPALFERDQRRTSEWEAMIVDQLIGPPASLPLPTARLIGGIWRACWTAAATRYGETSGRHDPHRLVDETFDLLREQTASLTPPEATTTRPGRRGTRRA